MSDMDDAIDLKVFQYTPEELKALLEQMQQIGWKFSAQSGIKIWCGFLLREIATLIEVTEPDDTVNGQAILQHCNEVIDTLTSIKWHVQTVWADTEKGEG